MNISYDDFEKVDLRSGTIIKVELFPRAKKPAYKVWADFGAEIGVLQTSAQVTVHYTPESLVGKSIVGILPVFFLNFCWLVLQMKMMLSV